MGSYANMRKTFPVELEDDDNYSSMKSTKSAQVMLEDPRPLPGDSLTLAVGLRRGRIAMLTIACVVFIVASTYVFGRGVELMKVDATSLTPAERTKLLDKYNSRSGSIASVFGKPIELFVSLSAQIIVLRVAATSFLQREPSWKAGMATLGVSAATGYLINNGFNSLNVQFRDDQVDVIISAEDLSSATTIRASAVSLVTNLTHTVSEMAPRNPVENTVLRNLFLPRVIKPGTRYCDYDYTQNEVPIYLPDDIVEYAITQRDWQTRLLPVALEPESVRVIVNPSNKTLKQAVAIDKFPMNASLAANLFMNGLLLANHYVPWRSDVLWYDPVAAQKRFPATKGRTDRLAPVAQFAGVLPTESMTEAKQREWFLRESPGVLNRNFNSSINTSRSDIVMEFSHVSISPTFSFDSLTFEVQVESSKVDAVRRFGSTNRTQTTRYITSQADLDCAPWPGLCMYPKPDYLPTATIMNEILYDSPAQVNAFSVCVDESSGTPTEDLQVYLNYTEDTYRVPCPSTSKSSMLIVSVAKRLVADASIQNASYTPNGTLVNSSNWVTVHNLKKIYSLTIGRLSWQSQDLSKLFSANCSVDPSSGNCSGFLLPLVPEDSATQGETPKQQYIVVGANALPFASLSPPTYASVLEGRRRLRAVPLVKVHEAPRQGGPDDLFYRAAAGDLLLPHNVQDLRWNMKDIYLRGIQCSSHVEERTHQVVSNHLYMESGLQASYTAAMLYLFQDAVVHDVVPLRDGLTTLSFKQNTKLVTVFVSIPKINAWLTMVGCALLVLGLSMAGVWTYKSEEADPLRQITEPQAIAQVMFNEKLFPPFLLHRHVIDPDAATDPRVNVDEFNMEGVSLKRVDAVDEWPAKQYDRSAASA